MILTNGFTEVCFGYKQTKDIILLSRENARLILFYWRIIRKKGLVSYPVVFENHIKLRIYIFKIIYVKNKIIAQAQLLTT